MKHWGGADPDAAARQAARVFAPDAGPPRKLRVGHNAVYGLRTRQGDRILRVSPPAWRTRRELLAELDFISHLARRGLAVGRPLATPDGRSVVRLHGGLHACQFRVLRGEPVARLHHDPGPARLASWGELLGRLDRASLEHAPLPGRVRPHWTDDPLASCPEAAIGANETRLLAVRRERIGWVRGLPEATGHFGLVHGDGSLVNLMFQGSQAALFDFDDSCHHHFAWDIACALYPHWDQRNRDFEAIANGFLDAYSREQPLPEGLLQDLPQWLQLRNLSVLLYFRKRRRPGDAWVTRATQAVLSGSPGLRGL